MRGPIDSKSNTCTESLLRRCGGHKREGESAIPGEICQPVTNYRHREVMGKGWQKSAEGIVGQTTGLKART